MRETAKDRKKAREACKREGHERGRDGCWRCGKGSKAEKAKRHAKRIDNMAKRIAALETAVKALQARDDQG